MPKFKEMEYSDLESEIIEPYAMMDVKRIYNIDNSSIAKCCKGKIKFAGKLEDGTKLHWMYYEDYEKQNNVA